MMKTELPKKPVLNSAFKEKGRDDVVKIDVFPVEEGEVLKLTFDSVNPPWRQGVWNNDLKVFRFGRTAFQVRC